MIRLFLRGPSCAFVNQFFFRLFQVSGAPTPHNGADHSRVKQGKFMAYGEQGPRPIKRVFY